MSRINIQKYLLGNNSELIFGNSGTSGNTRNHVSLELENNIIFLQNIIFHSKKISPVLNHIKV